MLLLALKKFVFRTQMRQFVTFHTCNRARVKKQALYYWAELKYPSVTSPNLTKHRFFFTNPERENEEHQLSLIWQPSPTTFAFPLLGTFVSYWNVRLKIDKEFRLKEVIKGAKQAVAVISSALATQNFKELDGIVKERTIKLLKDRVSRLSQNQRNVLSLKSGYLIYTPLNIRIKKCKAHNEKVVEVSVIGVCIRDLSQSRILPENVHLFNYVFARKYTDGIGGTWIARIVNHFIEKENSE